MLLKQARFRVYGTDPSGRLLAEMTFPMTAPGVFCIDHTFVDASLRGQGVGDELMRAALAQIREHGGTVVATCSYAKAWLERHPEAIESKPYR